MTWPRTCGRTHAPSVFKRISNRPPPPPERLLREISNNSTQSGTDPDPPTCRKIRIAKNVFTYGLDCVCVAFQVPSDTKRLYICKRSKIDTVHVHRRVFYTRSFTLYTRKPTLWPVGTFVLARKVADGTIPQVASNIFSRLRSPVRAAGYKLLNRPANSVTALVAVIKRTVFNTTTCKRVSPCSILSMDVRICKIRILFYIIRTSKKIIKTRSAFE